ncbi:hypothetical protein [Arthrobacter sp. 35W]|uniref:hypothetical protein n=1 Tax=Arthrobacter sp. 35W TaxID=1132441 RepID=UPI00041AD650|nr:hypothetical protein [Arthrobacter sp. 35W]
MSPQLSAHASPAAEAAGAVGSVLASLPVSLGPGGADADIRAISGKPGWTAEALAAIAGGARGLVVVEPAAEDTAVLAAAAESAGVPVVLDHRWASNAAVDGAAAAVLELAGGAALLDSAAAAAPHTDPELLLGEHLALVFRIAGGVQDLHIISSGPRGYTAAGRLPNGAPVALQGILTRALPGGVRLDLLTADGGVRISVPDPDTARPAETTVTTPSGATTLPTIFESAHRTSWRRLTGAVAASAQTPDLPGFDHLSSTLVRFRRH